MFSRFFRRKKSEEEEYAESSIPANANWSFIGADIHSHFVPGIDDGAKTIDDSIALLKAMEGMGYKKIVTTPHVMSDFYPNNTQIIQAGLKKIQDAAKENNINLEISAAAEYYIDETFTELLAREPLLTIHKNEVLVEFSMLYEPPMLYNALFAMQTAGYKPIIAHPERYMFFHNNFERYRELKDKGCLLQLNLLAISGYYGRNIMEVALRLLSKGMYDYCGSDMHHEKHAAALKNMLQTKAYTTLVGYPFLNSRLVSV